MTRVRTGALAVADPSDTAVTTYRRDPATWVAFAALFAFGLLNAMLGPALPYLRQTQHLSYFVGALHQVAFALGGMTAGILASRSSANRRRTIVVGLGGAAGSALLLGYGHVFALTMIGAFLVSGFATAALIRVWAWVADLHHRHRAVAMTEGEVAVSLAGIVTPVLLSVFAASALGWRFAFVVVSVLVVGAAATVRATRVTVAVAHQGPAERIAGHTPARLSRRRSLTTIFAVVSLEFTLSFWAASYLHDDVGIAQATATALVSVLYAANLVGRLVASRLARRLPVATVLRLALATALAGVPILLAAGDAPIAALGLFVTGAGIGGTFPLAASLHVAASDRTADQALGQILTVAGVGEIIGPLLAGALAQAASLRVGLLVLPVLALLGVASSRPHRHEHGTPASQLT
jgi:MFS family permease